MSTEKSTNIAVLGTGAMGSRMTLRLLKAGHNVKVWNRSPDPAEALASSGAVVATSVAAACAGVSVILAMVRDDEASRMIWLGNEGALNAAEPDTLAIDCSTLSPHWAEELAKASVSRSIAFVAAPVLGSRPQAEMGQLIALLGGNTAEVERAVNTTAVFAGKSFHIGNAAQAASAKLAVNAFFATQLAAAGELIAYFRALGIKDEKWFSMFSDIPVVAPGIAGAMKGMSAGNFTPMFPIELVDKDLSYFIESADRQGAGSEIVLFIRALYKRAIDLGHKDDNITGIQQIFK